MPTSAAVSGGMIPAAANWAVQRQIVDIAAMRRADQRQEASPAGQVVREVRDQRAELVGTSSAAAHEHERAIADPPRNHRQLFSRHHGNPGLTGRSGGCCHPGRFRQ